MTSGFGFSLNTAGALSLLFALVPATVLAGEPDLKSKALHNPAAHIPSQCYTKTRDETGKVYNPCFTCHVRSRKPNFVSDPDLQQNYSFPAAAQKNNWTNLFKDRSKAVSAISDKEIRTYIRKGNYFAKDGSITLANRLKKVPAAWDFDNDGQWSGYTPDCYFKFDEEGFDYDPSGKMTGWRAFAYVPLPGGFWPANGSTDDVLIRLPAAYREDENGKPSKQVYKINLAIVEALIKRKDVAIEETDEAALKVDLDKDGKLGKATKIAFDWAPLEGRNMSYVGRARLLVKDGKAKLAAGLYPQGTEFLHTVRYIDTDENGEIRMAARMKEVRYGVKTRWQTYADLEDGALKEVKERDAFPDRLPLFVGDIEQGITNGFGWRYQGFIEDKRGELRPQTFEETVFCMGCHGGVGITDDSNFAFPRKLDAKSTHARGWYHWTQKSIKGTPDPMRADGRRELLTYLNENGAGDEFRGNMEIRRTFFGADGKLKKAMAEALKSDISVLLFPSVARAMALNKAYREIVKEQSFILGRDAVITPGTNVHKRLKDDETTGVKKPVRAPLW